MHGKLEHRSLIVSRHTCLTRKEAMMGHLKPSDSVVKKRVYLRELWRFFKIILLCALQLSIVRAEFAAVKIGHLQVYKKLFSCYHDLLVLLQAAVLHVANTCRVRRQTASRYHNPTIIFLKLMMLRGPAVGSGRVA